MDLAFGHSQRRRRQSHALHELANNAANCGALSNLEGRVCISRTHVAPNGPDFRMTWIEDGGPPVVVPTRGGFGLLRGDRSRVGLIPRCTSADRKRAGNRVLERLSDHRKTGERNSKHRNQRDKP